MNGYLMLETNWTPGEDCFFESFSPENRYGVVFEDDGEAAYFYAVEKDDQGSGVRILDALHIHEASDPAGDDPHEADSTPTDDQPQDPDEASDEPNDDDPADLKIIWSRDWLKCALVLDGYVYALFDFENQGGYNINEFPPPNSIWTQSDRTLTPELIARFF